MPRHRTSYPPEFRQQTIELVRSGRTRWELTQEFEPSAQAIINGVAQADRDSGVRDDGPTSAEKEELRRLRQAKKRLREEREILAKGDENQRSIQWMLLPRNVWNA